MEGGGLYRAVHSSGGAAGGVVSEGQAYGMLLAGTVAASLGSSHANFSWVVDRGVELYRGWRRMCSLSISSSACQSYYCANGTIPCLPHWKFDDSLSVVWGTGSATDADEDAVLALILLLRATESNKASYSWWNEMSDHTYQTCRAFLDFDTSQGIIKLGSCWGGWSCTNPSYFAPVAYRACRDFMERTNTVYTASWNTLLSNTYAVLRGAQCASTGLVTNWYIPVSQSSPSATGASNSSCTSSTPPAQFGAEASRTMWRLAADYIIYRTSGGMAFSTPAARQTISKNSGPSTWLQLDTGCLVTSIFSNWSNEGFMFAPLFTTLTIPTGIANQTTVLANAANKIAAWTFNDYYSSSWIAIATTTINGDLEKAGMLLRPSPYPSCVQ